MKKLILLFVTCILVVACTSHKEEVKEEEIVEEVIEEPVEEIVEPDNDIVGLIMVGDNNRICIVENWDSDSPVQYYIARDYEDAFREKVNHIIRVRGEVKQQYSKSKYAIQIDSIIYIN